MPLYENVFIARQDVSSQQVEAMAEDFTKLVADNGGAIAKTEFWGVRGLTYRIKKNRKGHYVLLNVDSPASAIAEMERQMRINEDILRYLTIKLDAFEEGPSVMMQSRQRDDRPRRYDNDSNNKPAAAPEATVTEAAAPEAAVAEAAAVETAEPASDGAES